MRKRKRKDHLPLGKDRHDLDLTSQPMIQALRQMEERAETRPSKRSRIAKPSTITSSSHVGNISQLKIIFRRL